MPQEISVSYQAIKSKVYRLVDSLVVGEKDGVGGSGVDPPLVGADPSCRPADRAEVSLHGVGKIQFRVGGYGERVPVGRRPGDPSGPGERPNVSQAHASVNAGRPPERFG